MIDQQQPGLTVDGALREWNEIRLEQRNHMAACDACTPYIAVCITGQKLAEHERHGWSLVRRAREAEGRS